MPEITLPESIRDVEPVRSVRTPAQLDYEFLSLIHISEPTRPY